LAYTNITYKYPFTPLIIILEQHPQITSSNYSEEKLQEIENMKLTRCTLICWTTSYKSTYLFINYDRKFGCRFQCK